MDALGLIIFIIFVLFKALGKIPDIKDKLPKDWENKFPKDWQENWPQEWQFPWNDDDDDAVEADAAKPEGHEPRREIGLEQTKESYEPVHFEGTPPEQEQRGAEVAATKKELTPHPIINSQSLLNGIIMSEVLQPPKCRRRVTR